jgi:putative transposase
VARLALFKKPADFEAFVRVLAEAHQRMPVEILAYCVMRNHWHFVLRPVEEGQLTAFLRWLTQTHTMRWRAQRHASGTGHRHQGRFKAFPVADDDHFYTVVRYVERNALRAGLVSAAEQWQWSSLWRREFGTAESRRLLARWPVPRPRDWLARVNAPMTVAELEAVRLSVIRNRPFGGPRWQETAAQQLGAAIDARARGRPRTHRS